MKAKRFLAVFVAALILCLSFASCGKGGNDSQATKSAEKTEASSKSLDLNALKSPAGTLKLSVSGDYSGIPIDAQWLMSLDSKSNKAYTSLNVKEIEQLAKLGYTGDLTLEGYTDGERINLAYDLFGIAGDYYVDAKNIMDDFEKSIFSPNGANVLNIDKKQYEQFKEAFDKMGDYGFMTTQNADFDEMIEKIKESIAKNSTVTTADAEITVHGKKIQTTQTTYAMTADQLKTMVLDMITIQNIPEEMIAEMTSELENSGIPDDAAINLSLFEDKSSKAPARITLNVESDGKQGEIVVDITTDPLYITVSSTSEFEKSSDFSAELKENIKGENHSFDFKANSKGEEITASLKKEVSGDHVKYSLSAKGGEDSFEAALDHNKKDNTFKFSATQNGKEVFSLPGTLKVTNDSITIGVNLQDIKGVPEAAKLNVTLEISKQTQIKEFASNNNLFDISEDDFSLLQNQIMQKFSPFMPKGEAA